MTRQMKTMLFLAGLLTVVSALLAATLPDRPTPANETETCPMNLKPLTPAEERVIVHKGTEMPFTGAFVHHHETGTYTCKRCGAKLFSSAAKFESGSGWPSFDEALPGAVRQLPDADGHRTEIVCAQCGAHLGHVFFGEGFTEQNARFCTNSISLGFEPVSTQAADNQAHAYFAGGCFWGVEYHLQQVPGVISAVSGYMGGRQNEPSYEDVCTGTTGHAETVMVTYDPAKVSYEQLAKLFFEIHDPTEVNRQGPDVGEQYRSAIFYSSDEEKRIIEVLIAKLRARGLAVATQVVPAGKFWPAEDYHQDYYFKKRQTPYCHVRVKRFD